jgi:hypothetical protein
MSSVLKNLNPINNVLILNPKTYSWRITSNEAKKMVDLINVIEQRFLNFFFRVPHVYIISHVSLIIKNRIIQTSHS